MKTPSHPSNILFKIFRTVVILIILTTAAGCGTTNQPALTNTQEIIPTSPPPTATNPPPPTDTPQPTDTPVPTDTATPLPTDTPTPDLKATEAFVATRAADQLILDIKAQLKEFGFTTDKGYLGWAQTEPQTITLSTFGDYFYTPFAEDLVASDFILRTDITWKTDGLVLCGLKFRSEPNFDTGAQYSFLYERISGFPAWAIEYYKDGDFVNTISDVKFSNAINMDNGATNNLLLAAEGNKFTLFVNDQKLGSYYDWSKLRSDGRFAFQGLQEKGPSTCSFNNTWVWMLK